MMGWAQWLAILIPAIGSGLFGGAVATWIKTRPAMKQAETQADGPLWTRIATLEAKLDLAAERIARLTSEMADLRHDFANETASFDSFLLLAETDPEKLATMLPKIREDRLRHKERMALKKGVREGAAQAKGNIAK